MKGTLLDAYPNAEISLSIIWINMLENDDEGAIHLAIQSFHDQRVRHFHDPKHLAGKVIAKSVHTRGTITWDMYLFYSKDIEWKEQPPVPFDWAYQLDEVWEGCNHFAWGDNLA